MKVRKRQPKPLWTKTPYKGIRRYDPSGTLYAYLRVGGKPYRKSLKTKQITSAKLRLADLEKELRIANESRQAVAQGKMTFCDALGIYLNRLVPMIEEMRGLLERLRAERQEDDSETRVMKVAECQKTMDRTAKKIGMKRITHHGLRHLFAPRCIEAGVDIPTVSRWLGHKDGGALAMKTYGHLRDHHSVEMVKRVSFPSKTASNVIPMPQCKEAVQ